MWLAAHTTKSHSNDILRSSTFFTSWAPAPSAVWGWTGSVPWVYESLFLLKTAAYCCWKWVRWEGGTEPHKKCAVKSKLWAKRGFGYCCDTINENPYRPWNVVSPVIHLYCVKLPLQHTVRYYYNYYYCSMYHTTDIYLNTCTVHCHSYTFIIIHIISTIIIITICMYIYVYVYILSLHFLQWVTQWLQGQAIINILYTVFMRGLLYIYEFAFMPLWILLFRCRESSFQREVMLYEGFAKKIY